MGSSAGFQIQFQDSFMMGAYSTGELRSPLNCQVTNSLIFVAQATCPLVPDGLIIQGRGHTIYTEGCASVELKWALASNEQCCVCNRCYQH